MSAPPVPGVSLCIAGPTACGKSAVAMALARSFPGEILSVDSMQVYRGMDIGTAKPSPAERTEIPHHLLDVAGLGEGFDAARFIELATPAVASIRARGRMPILCGGTGLYFKAWLEGLGESPPSDPILRAELEATPLAALLGELERMDPATYGRIDRQNPRRVIRAVEVIRLTGRPFSLQRADWSTPASGATPTPDPGFFYLDRDPADLRRRIDERVEGMFRAGWVEEVRHLMEGGLEGNRAALQAIGYRQIVEHLRGKVSLAATLEEVKVRTRQYARRQRIWFLKQSRATRLPVAPEETPEATSRRIRSLFEQGAAGRG